MEKEILKIADDANNGLSNPLGAYVELKRLEKAVKMCLESVKPYAVAEANKYHENSFTEFGATIEKRNAPGTWNFKHIDEWANATKKVKAIEEMAKDAYKQSLKGKTITDNDGVIVKEAIYTTGESIIAVKL